MPYLFTIEQLAERGYAVYASSRLIAWCWACKDISLVQPANNKAEAIAAASQHCRENYVPPRPDGVPENAEFRLPKKGDFLKLVSSGVITNVTSGPIANDRDSSENDPFNGRRWCWREADMVEADKTLADEVFQEIWREVVKASGSDPLRYGPYAGISSALILFRDELTKSNPNIAKMRRELIQIAAMAVRAIHDAKGWGQ